MLEPLICGHGLVLGLGICLFVWVVVTRLPAFQFILEWDSVSVKSVHFMKRLFVTYFFQHDNDDFSTSCHGISANKALSVMTVTLFTAICRREVSASFAVSNWSDVEHCLATITHGRSTSYILGNQHQTVVNKPQITACLSSHHTFSGSP